MLGLLLFLTNQFRPIIIIYFIALFLTFLFKVFFQKEDSIRKFMILFFLIGIVYVALGKLSILYFDYVNQIKSSRVSTGWSVFCGANIESNGEWSISDSAVFGELSEKEKDVTKVQKMTLDKGLERYQKLGVKVIPLYIQKFRVLTGRTVEQSWNAFFSLIQNQHLFKMKNIVFELSKIYYNLLLLSNFMFAYYVFHKKGDKNSNLVL